MNPRLLLLFLAFLIASPVGAGPSGYVKDTSGNSIYNAKVLIWNSTWTDSCLGNCYSDVSGFYSTGIYADGVYNYKVSRQGYADNTSSRTFTIGGTNINFTLTPSEGQISGYIYELKTSSGSFNVKGDLDSLKSQSTGGTVLVGGTMILSGGYVIRLEDVDSGNGQVVIDILKNGVNVYDDLILNKNQRYSFKVEETAFSGNYVDVLITDVLQGGGGEINLIKLNAGVRIQKKLFVVLADFINYLLSPYAPGGIQNVLLDLSNWVDFTTDGTNAHPVWFNATDGHDAVGSLVFDVGSEANVFSYYFALTANSTSQSNGKVKIGYTDDDYEVVDFYTDTLYINDFRVYRGAKGDFKALDADGDNKVKAWFMFETGYSSMKIYELYLIAYGSDTVQPLVDASVYYNGTYSTVSKSPDGYYSMAVPFGTDLVRYRKDGYESKNITHVFNASYPTFTQDIFLNKTDLPINTTAEYVYVSPDPVVKDQAAYAYFKTLDKTNPLIPFDGGYQIAVCPLIDPRWIV